MFKILVEVYHVLYSNHMVFSFLKNAAVAEKPTPKEKGTNEFDLIVIGAGSGLNVAAHAADAYRWKVAVVEEGPLGGTCLNRGCIPSKIIIHAADVAEEIRGAERFGITAKIESIDFAKVTRRATSFVDDDAVHIEEGVRAHPRMSLLKNRGSFKDARTVIAGGAEIRSERILIAAGTRPAVPPIPGLKETGYITSDEALRLEKQPASLAIVGGGYISTELGHFFGALGTKVSIFENSPVLLGREDEEVSKLFTKAFSEKHTVLLGVKVERVEKRGNLKAVIARNAEGKEVEVVADEIMLSVGRTSNADTLNLPASGVKTNERGFIEVNEYMETSVPGIWALGDIVGKAPFKHGANWEAEHVMTNIRGASKRAVDYSIMPHAIFSSPQIAGVGLTEQEAKAKNIRYAVQKKKYIATGMGKAMEEGEAFAKFIVDPEKKKILGCHIIGPQASTLIHEVIVALKAGGDISLVRDVVHIHPALSEVVQRALRQASEL